MGFYYVSIISIFLLGAIYAVLLLIFWGIARLMRGMPGRKAVLIVVGAVFLVLPVAEELWIAWNFGQLCKKDAGLFVKKTVEVEGFYDDTTHWWRQLAESKYQFVESRDNTYGGLFRVERDGEGLRHFKIDRPTARYHFLIDSGAQVGHGVRSQTSTIVDTQSAAVLARYTRYNRTAPWFYVGLDRPRIGCDGPDGGPKIRHSFLIYRDALRPASGEKGMRK